MPILKRPIYVALMLLTSITAAQADFVGDIQGWDVDDLAGDYCTAASFKNDAVIIFGANRERQTLQIFKDRTIEILKTGLHTAEFLIDGTMWSAQVELEKTDAFESIHWDGVPRDFIAAARDGRSFTGSIGGHRMNEYTLAGSRDALNALDECVAQLK